MSRMAIALAWAALVGLAVGACSANPTVSPDHAAPQGGGACVLTVKTKYGEYTELPLEQSVKSRVLPRTKVVGTRVDCQNPETYPMKFNRLRGFSPKEALYPTGFPYTGRYRVIFVPMDEDMEPVYSTKVKSLLDN